MPVWTQPQQQGPVNIPPSENAASNAFIPAASRASVANPSGSAAAVTNQPAEKPGFFAKLFGAGTLAICLDHLSDIFI